MDLSVGMLYYELLVLTYGLQSAPLDLHASIPADGLTRSIVYLHLLAVTISSLPVLYQIYYVIRLISLVLDGSMTMLLTNWT